MRLRILTISAVALVAIFFGLSPRVADAQRMVDPCTQTPGSAPQLPLSLGASSFARSESFITIIGLGGPEDLMSRVKRVILVAPSGPIEVIQATSHNAITVAPTDNIHASVVRISIPTPHNGVYRVLIEDKDLSSPPGCPISFIEAIGSVSVQVDGVGQ